MPEPAADAAGLLVAVTFERGSGAFRRAAARGYVQENGIGEFEAHDGLRLNLNLLAAGDGVGSRAETTSATEPIAAPLPPPRMPPRMAPTAAPPPTFSAVFLPRPSPCLV